MRNFRLLIALAVLITTPALMVLGQSTPNFTQGQIPSLSQWNGYFGAKADLLYLAENVMADGAKADGTSDDSGAINTALGKTLNGQSKNVYMPAGTYHVKHAINLGANQCLIGDGWNTIIDVGSDFSSTDPGVIVVATNGGGGNQACVKNLLFNVNQVTDLTKTTTASSGEGAITITVNSNSGIVVGDYVADQSNKNAILSGQNSIGAQPTVTNISGNTITISQPVQTGSGGVGNGDSIHFAPTRSMYKTLAQGCTTTAGGTGCKFPWLIYNNGANTFYVDHVFAQGAWDGVYQRGSAFYFGTMFIGAADVGLDIDNCHNSPTIVNYQHWFWGYQNTVNNTTAVSDIVYDGNMVAANIGAVDGASFHSLQTFEGIYNFTANFSYGHISSLIADGNNAEINFSATGSGHLELGEVYTSGSRFDGAPKWNVNNTNNQYIEIGVWRSAQNLSATPSLLVAGGVVSIGSGSFYSSASGTGPVISVTGGKLNLGSAVHFGGSTITPIISQSGTGAISAVGVHFGGSTPGVGVQIGADNVENVIKDVNWNGWTLTGPSGTFNSGALGTYEASAQQAIRTVSSGTTDTASTTDRMITWNSSGAITETVNGCGSNNAGKEIFFNDKSGHGGTIDPSGTSTVNGTATYSAAANSKFVIKCDGVSNWVVK